MNRHKIIIISSLTLTIAVLIFSSVTLVNYLNQVGKERINIIVAPSDAVLSLDSKPIKAGELYIEPGKHQLVVRRDNFNQKTVAVNTVKNKVVEVPVWLTPKDIVGENVVKKQQDAFLKVSGTASRQFYEGEEIMTKNNPIIQQLPVVVSPIFRIDYGISKKYPNDPSKIALYISANSALTRQNALYSIYTMRYDPSDYEIIFQPLDSSNL
jgi:hypothetical protein